jgi:hypothetical protein
VLILNAPPNSGKDTIADYLVANHGYTKLSFKSALFELLYKVFSITDPEQFMEEYYTREAKEQPCSLLRIGDRIMSPREALIFLSESVVKPLWGDAYFGTRAAQLIDSTTSNLYVFADGGFLAELIPLVDKVGAENITVAKIERDGCTFVGDSRGYVDASSLGCNTFWVANDSTIEEVAEGIHSRVIPNCSNTDNAEPEPTDAIQFWQNYIVNNLIIERDYQQGLKVKHLTESKFQELITE